MPLEPLDVARRLATLPSSKFDRLVALRQLYGAPAPRQDHEEILQVIREVLFDDEVPQAVPLMPDPAKLSTYVPSQQQVEDLYKRFTYHPPKVGQPGRYARLRESGMALASILLSECPTSRELSLALTKLEEAIMWANAAIARNE